MSEDYAPGMSPEYRQFQDQAAAEVRQAEADAELRQRQSERFMNAEGPGVSAGDRLTGD